MVEVIGFYNPLRPHERQRQDAIDTVETQQKAEGVIYYLLLLALYNLYGS